MGTPSCDRCINWKLKGYSPSSMIWDNCVNADLREKETEVVEGCIVSVNILCMNEEIGEKKPSLEEYVKMQLDAGVTSFNIGLNKDLTVDNNSPTRIKFTVEKREKQN